MPALVTVSNEVGELRYISRTRMLKMIQGARSIPSWSAVEIGVNPEALQKMAVTALSSPPDMGRDCQFMEGAPEEMAEKLAAVFMSLK